MNKLNAKENYSLEIIHLVSDAPYLQTINCTVVKPVKPIVIEFSNLNDAIKGFLLFKGYQETICQNPYIQCCIQLKNADKHLLLVCGRPGFGLYNVTRTYAVDSLIFKSETGLCQCFLNNRHLYNSTVRDFKLAKQLLSNPPVSETILKALKDSVAQVTIELQPKRFSNALSYQLTLETNLRQYFKLPCLQLDLNFDYKGLYTPNFYKRH